MDLAVLWPPDFYTTRPLHLHQSLQNGSFFGYWPGEACIRAWDLGSRKWVWQPLRCQGTGMGLMTLMMGRFRH